MEILTSSNRRIHESNLELFKARLAGKLCIAFVGFAQIISRLIIVFSPPILESIAEFLLLISVFTFTLMIIVIAVEYLFYKKIGVKVAKYSDFVDIALLLLFMADWTITLTGSLMKIQHTDPPTFDVTAIYGFTNFAWKTILITLIAQKWQLKIIPPVVASIIAAVFTTCYAPNNALNNITRAVFQLFNIITIIYCEDKIKWRMIWKNLYQEKWMQVNNFILNNIPENIMILGFDGKTKFTSDYCKLLMEKCHISGNTSEFFKSIQELRQQYDEPERKPSIARFTTQNEFIGGEFDDNYMKIGALEDLVANFREIIEEKRIQERQFLVYYGKLKMENKDFSTKSIEIKISFIKHVENEFIILILRDTTQRDLLITLEETNKYKDELLASVSHELRAPLNGNINLVESAIQSKMIPSDLKETLLIPALRSSKFLLHIINDIIDMSQINQRKLRLVFQNGDLKETLRNAAQLVELQAQKKGIELVLEFDPKVPNKFCTDHMRLSQIVLNLLSNAIRFTKEGTVKLKVVAERVSCVRIFVEDTGIGIHQENLHKFFSSEMNIELEEKQIVNPAGIGVGLGLKIASNLADLLAPKDRHGINSSSVPQQGSVFSFVIENKETIPEGRQDSEHSSLSNRDVPEELPGIIQLKFSAKSERNEGSFSLVPLQRTFECQTLVELPCLCPKVLIVDDNPFNTMAFETILKSLEIKCESVYSGSACIQKLLKRQGKTCGKNCMSYSVIFMDQEMPEMTGSETVREIKRLQDKSLIPEMRIIGCTAHKAKEDVENFIESGLDSCIFKPISVMMIKDILKEIF